MTIEQITAIVAHESYPVRANTFALIYQRAMVRATASHGFNTDAASRELAGVRGLIEAAGGNADHAKSLLFRDVRTGMLSPRIVAEVDALFA